MFITRCSVVKKYQKAPARAFNFAYIKKHNISSLSEYIKNQFGCLKSSLKLTKSYDQGHINITFIASYMKIKYMTTGRN